MDKGFISRAEQYTAFSFYPNDLTSVKYKNEIRHIISKNWFPKIQNDHYVLELNKDKINDSIHKLKEHNGDGFNRLYSYNLKGVGPGEIMLYYIIDGAEKINNSVSGVDMRINGDNYEVKAVKTVYNKFLHGTYMNDFKLGGSVNLVEIMKGLQEIGKVNSTELSASKINDLRSDNDFLELEQTFRQLVVEYFRENQIIFLSNEQKNLGEVIDIRTVKSDHIYIERMTSGTIKPLVKKDD